VNALLESDRRRKGREWEYEKVNSVCLLCGNGCEISVSTKDGGIHKINSGAVTGSVEKYICAYGRFGFDCIEAESRLASPLKRIDGELRETTWEDALGLVADRLKKAGQDAGFISIAGIENEDALILKKLAKNFVKTKNFDTTMSLYSDAGSLRNSHKADIDEADLIVLVGLNPSQWGRILPALDASVRRRVSRGAKLIVINSTDTKMADAATVNLQGNEISILKRIAKALIGKGFKADKKLGSAVKDVEIAEEIEKAAPIAQAKNPLIFSSPHCLTHQQNSSDQGKVISAIWCARVCTDGINNRRKTYKEMTGTAESKSRGQSAKSPLYSWQIPLQKRPGGVDFIV
jgi:predicted molibdopterin-dependent oxidoreductase YjgC